jgi:hypothetical protein
LTSRKAFHALPQMLAYQESVGTEHYRSQMKRLEWHPDYIRVLKVIEGAQQGVTLLAAMADELAYCTARMITFHSGWNEQLALATHFWLKNKGFPNHDAVLFCDAYRGKLETIASQLQTEPRDVWLIDDSMPGLLEAFSTLSQAQQTVLSEHLTLVAFGHADVPAHAPIRLIPFPGWKEIQLIEKEFDYDKEIQRRQS